MTRIIPLKHRFLIKLLACAGLVGMADFLFYTSDPLGGTVGLFAVLLLLAVSYCRPQALAHRFGTLLAFAALGLSLALIETPAWGTMVLYTLTLATLTLLPRFETFGDAYSLLRWVTYYLVVRSWLRVVDDSILLLYLRKRARRLQGKRYALLLQWALPVACSLGFVLLFAKANPLIERWVGQVSLQFLVEYLSFARINFWLVMVAGCWALLRPKLRLRQRRVITGSVPRFTLIGLLFNAHAVLLSLVLFNALFLMQNALDVAFLWSGAALPEGMSHAHYAHRGAYPLLMTALLAAVFILVAFRPGQHVTGTVRALVYVWVGQNVFLVLSSIVRLLGYIEAYSLTYLRVAALIWMGLVACGLLLIVARIHLRHSNRWLINTNGVVLYATLYLCCFVNFGGLIAQYNVAHAHEISGRGQVLDMRYLQYTIGVDAIPALLWYRAHYPVDAAATEAALAQLREKLPANARSWRSWTFRNYRLSQQLNGGM